MCFILKMYFIGIEINLTFSTSDSIVLTCMLQQLIQPNQLPAFVEVSGQHCPPDRPHLVIQTLNMVDHVASHRARPTAHVFRDHSGLFLMHPKTYIKSVCEECLKK